MSKKTHIKALFELRNLRYENLKVLSYAKRPLLVGLGFRKHCNAFFASIIFQMFSSKSKTSSHFKVVLKLYSLQGRDCKDCALDRSAAN